MQMCMNTGIGTRCINKSVYRDVCHANSILGCLDMSIEHVWRCLCTLKYYPHGTHLCAHMCVDMCIEVCMYRGVPCRTNRSAGRSPAARSCKSVCLVCRTCTAEESRSCHVHSGLCMCVCARVWCGLACMAEAVDAAVTVSMHQRVGMCEYVRWGALYASVTRRCVHGMRGIALHDCVALYACVCARACVCVCVCACVHQSVRLSVGRPASRFIRLLLVGPPRWSVRPSVRRFVRR